jgi:hypothetical protein
MPSQTARHGCPADEFVGQFDHDIAGIGAVGATSAIRRRP